MRSFASRYADHRTAHPQHPATGTTRLRELLGRVPIPYPWDPQEYVHRTAEHRGRPIIVHEVDAARLAGSGCSTGSGLWIAREHDDVILYGAGTTDWHAEHIVCHEIGHMLLEHDRMAGEPDNMLDPPLLRLMPSLSPDAVRAVLRRQDYGTDHERDAETFADLVMVEATLPRRNGSMFRSTFFRARHR